MKLTKRQLRRLIESNLTGDSGNDIKPAKTLSGDDNDDEETIGPQQDIEVADDLDIPPDAPSTRVNRRGFIKGLIGSILAIVGYKTVDKFLTKDSDIDDFSSLVPNPNRETLDYSDVFPEHYLRFDQLTKPFFLTAEMLLILVAERYGNDTSYDDVLMLLEEHGHELALQIPWIHLIKDINNHFELPVYDSNLIIGYIKEIIQYILDVHGESDIVPLVLWILKEYVELIMVKDRKDHLDLVDP